MDLMQEERLKVRKQIAVQSRVPEEFHSQYYSSWMYAAVHVMLSIPRFQNPKAMSEHLGLSLSEVQAQLDFLLSAGLAEKSGGKWRIASRRIHLGPDSPFISRHHANWRLRSIQSCERNRSEDLHYSGVVTLSEDDVRKIRQIFLESVRLAEETFTRSKEEAAFGICVDFFRV